MLQLCKQPRLQWGYFYVTELQWGIKTDPSCGSDIFLCCLLHVVADGLSPLTSLLQVLCSHYLYGESRWRGIRWSLLFVVLSIQMPNVHLLECSSLKSQDITKEKEKPKHHQALLKHDVHEGEKLHTYSLVYIQRICYLGMALHRLFSWRNYLLSMEQAGGLCTRADLEVTLSITCCSKARWEWAHGW